MCGIAGFNLSPADQGNINVRAVSEALLNDIVSRGRDATGAAWFDPETGACMVQKNDDPATKFVTYLEIPEGATNAIFHTRAATQGSPSLNENNHPIVVRNLVGVHNGCIRNDDEIFELIGKEKRTAQVDSEAIFAAINFGHWVVEGKPVISDNLLDILGKPRGGAAIAWLQYDTTNVLHLARLSGSPLIIAHTEGGSLFFASTAKALHDAARKAKVELRGATYSEKTHDIPEGTYLKVVDGLLASSHSFTPATRNAGEDWRSASSQYSSTAPKAKKDDKKDDKKVDKKDDKKVPTSTTSVKKEDPKPSGPNTPSSKAPDAPTDNTTGKEWMTGTNGEILPLSVLREADVPEDNLGAWELALDAIHASLVESVGSISDTVKATAANGEKRLTAIAEYVEGLTVKDDDAEFFRVTDQLGAWLEVGDWCLVKVFGREDVAAQLVSLPTTFPGGEYILRCYIANEDAPNGYETAIIARKLGGFVNVGPVEEPLVEAITTAKSAANA